ncbi:MAG: heavy-metal-associated domain-containing protein [Rhodobacterales bacterium]|jgi:copper chaperone|nr:heavy-metal-associated domain-containing protein [Pseudomonadota bacterium]MDA1286536.1 heavy-metal-associated domain-containing protein [Pseudomonadota bacterium]NQW15644.1 heavy-metal-associated domain-containing protein [Rhodobacter sp.]HBN31515.1 copper chaperone [Paracoccaceae bacterium]
MTLLNVPDMTCGHCKATVETALRGVDADADILVDLAAKTVSVTSKAPTPALINALAAAGYPATIPS